MLDFIAIPFGKFLYFIYKTLAFENYGWAIILFTVIVKLLLLPLTIKQLKSSAKTQELQPLIQELNKRYKNDKQKLQQETMKLYQQHGHNPMSGCLPLLVQFPILIALYRVVTSPLKFMLGKAADQIQQIVALTGATASAGARGGASYYGELSALNILNNLADKFNLDAAFPGITQYIQPDEVINLNFLGLQLGRQATYEPSVLFGAEASIYIPLFILAVFAVVMTFISSKMSMPKVQQNNNSQNPAGCSTNSMIYIGPLMTLMFAFTLPSAMVLYWTAGYVFQIFQQLYVNKYVIKKKDNNKEVAKK